MRGIGLLAVASGLGACTPASYPLSEPLAIESISPAPGAEEVDPGAAVVVRFSHPLDPATVGNGLRLLGPDGLVEGVVTVDADGRTLRHQRLSPAGLFEPHAITVRGTVRSAEGALLGADVVSTYRTRGERLVVDRLAVHGLVGTATTVAATVESALGLVPAHGARWSSSAPTAVAVTGTGATAAVSFLAPGFATVTVEAFGLSTTVPAGAAGRESDGSMALLTGSEWTDATVDPARTFRHVWDLTCRGTVADGGSDTYDDVWWPMAHLPNIQNTDDDEDVNDITDDSFPCIPAAEIVFEGPRETVASLRREAVDDWNGYRSEGLASCHLRPLGYAGAYQEMQLPAQPSALTLSWDDFYRLGDKATGARYQVSVENLTDGIPPIVVAVVTTDGITASPGETFQSHAIDLLPLGLAGKRVRLRFDVWGGGPEGVSEFFAGLSDTKPHGVYVDDVRLIDGQAIDYVTNGGCEAGLAGWTGETVLLPRSVRLPARRLDDDGHAIDLSRSIYAPYAGGHWIRHLDTVTNPNDDDRLFTLRMEGDLGSDGGGVVTTAGTMMFAVDTTAPDGFGGAFPDVMAAMVPGRYVRLDPLLVPGEWSAEYDLALGPGESVNLLAFQVLGDSNDPDELSALVERAEELFDSIRTLGYASPYAEGISIEDWDRIVNW